MCIYHYVCASLLNSQSTLASSSLNDDWFSSQYLLFFLILLSCLSYQSFDLTCVYTFIALSLLTLLSCSSCWEWADHPVRLGNKSIFLYHKYSPHKCVLYISVRANTEKEKVTFGKRSDIVMLGDIVHWPSVTHARTGSLYTYVS
jgi:hypothetical protein